MSKKPATSVGIWLDGYALQAASNLARLDVGADSLDLSTFASAWREFGVGPKGARFAAGGFFDQPVEGATFAALGNARRILSLAPDSPAVGSPAYAMRCMLGEWRTQGAMNEALAWSIAGSLDEPPLVRGVVLDSQTRGSSGNGTILQVGPVPSGKTAYAALHVLAVSGVGASLALTVQSASASGFSTPTTRITFSPMTAVGAQWASVAGPITHEYWRASWTLAGTGPSVTAVLTFGIT